MSVKAAEKTRASILGTLLAMITVIIALMMPKQKALDLLSILLAFIAGINLGFAFSDGRRRELIFEIANILVIFLLVCLALWVTPVFLAIGYFAHGVWDVLHHPHFIQTRVVEGYPLACLLYDWIVAGFIFIWIL